VAKRAPDRYRVLSLAGEIDYWRAAVHQQAGRVSALGTNGNVDDARSQQIDMHFFAISLSQLLGACQRANGLDLSEAGKAVADFAKRHPHAKEVRDFLEHEAAYHKGDGQMHRQGRLPTGVRQVAWYEHDGDDSQVVITQELTLKVQAATRDAEYMATAVLVALHASISS
jgi:hypothetical protein